MNTLRRAMAKMRIMMCWLRWKLDSSYFGTAAIDDQRFDRWDDDNLDG